MVASISISLWTSWTSQLRVSPLIALPVSKTAGQARTEEFVKDNGGDDAEFDAFVQPANLILSTFIKAGGRWSGRGCSPLGLTM